MKTKEPLISVIMIFFNGERFMEEAIASVFAQTWGNWELILVDDGSTDGSSRLAQAHAARRPERVRYVQHPGHANRGMSASRNRGLEVARGDYIAFLDADDVYLPPKLERQAAALAAQPRAAMVFGPTLHWYSWTGREKDRQRDVPRKTGVPGDTLVEPPALVPLFLRLQAQTPATCGMLVRREALARTGGFDDAFSGLFEDQVFVYKVCLSLPVYVMAQSWDRYRQHPDSWCRVQRRRGNYHPYRPNPAYERFLLWLDHYMAQQQIVDGAVRRQLRRELWPYRHPLLSRLTAWQARLAALATHLPWGTA